MGAQAACFGVGVRARVRARVRQLTCDVCEPGQGKQVITSPAA